MTREHDALRDLIAPVALGSAEPHEVARVEVHASECAVCREELASLRAGADVLGMAVPQMDPPADLKASLMATVRAEAPARAIAAGVGGEPAAARSRPAPRRRSWFAGLLRPWPALAAVATVAALLLGWNIALQTGSDDPSRPVSTLAVSGTPDAPGVTGRVLYVPDEDTAVVSLSRLPQLAEGDAYQLWVIRDGQATSAGLFEQTGPAEARTVATGLAGADALAVTAQPRTSRTAPEGPILVEAAFQVG
jgi:Anti-sigma-K factor rskA